eukprot:TRINITY_DN9042_c0_g1_i4.p1 TRINITY_DN9042_c0_g1~~TRINITY_DN9042_c0_g1_i4.p1  ORF type:complete len:794 (+),score=177.14 TRINITY_DN9042_c0_g1_i4:95-2383(+)
MSTDSCLVDRRGSTNFLHSVTTTICPQIPDDEFNRLQELFRYEGYSPDRNHKKEEAFDRITTLCTKLFDVPIAIITFVDTQCVTFKSVVGIPCLELQRDNGFCAWTILNKHPFIVPDMTQDPRFVANKLVTDAPHFRSYVGAPLITPSGYNIGALCLIDSQPRHYTDSQIEHLQSLAGLVIDLLEAKTWRLKAQNEFQKSDFNNQRLLKAVNCFSEGLVMWNKNKEIIFANEGMERITGYSAAEAMKMPFDFLHGVGTQASAKEQFKKALESDQNSTLEMVSYKKDATIFWNFLRITPIFEAGEIMAYFGVLSDVTERKVVEIELERTKRIAEKATETKSAFVANMSHEMRTPLNAIYASSGLALETRPNPETKELLDMIHTSAHVLLALVDDVLDFSKIEAEKIELKPARFHLRECIETVIDMVNVKATSKNLEMGYTVHPSVPQIIFADEIRIRQILTNLLSNAVTFTVQGSIQILVEAKRVNESRYRFDWMIKDTGPGIDPSNQLRLFEVFSQVDDSRTRRHGGTGLGLAISKRLARLMGGDVWVKSKLGEGSVFGFSILIDVASDEVQTVPFTKCRLVAGHPVQESMLKSMMRSVGVECVEEGYEFMIADCRTDHDFRDPKIPLILIAPSALHDRRGSLERKENTFMISQPIRFFKLMGGDVWVKSKLGEGSVFGFSILIDVASDEVQTVPFTKCRLVAGHPVQESMLKSMMRSVGVECVEEGYEFMIADCRTDHDFRDPKIPLILIAPSALHDRRGR